MWLRTVMNYQYKTGASFGAALSHLYKEGGVGRFYKGLLPALLMVPLSRFGDTASNEAATTLLAGVSSLPLALRTACGSAAAGLFRVTLTPLDVLKTELQVRAAAAAAIAGLRP